MESSLYIGRFQPFHLGHLDALEQCFADSQQVIIGIGSATDDYQPENPFTASERYQMIESTLRELPEYKGRYIIIPVPNINRYAAWPAHIEALVPPFKAVYTGSDLTAALFEQYSAHPVTRLKKNIAVSATEVRSKMIAGHDWESLLPKPVVVLLKKWNGLQRVRMVNAG